MRSDIEQLKSKLNELQDIVDYLELELIDDPDWNEPSDTSYLNDTDRANPDIMANVAAMNKTNKLISWLGRDAEGFVGLWRGPEQTPLELAPIVRLDTEGQYAIVARTIPDYVAVCCNKDEFTAFRQKLVAAGFNVAASVDEIWNTVDGIYNDANNYRDTLYEEYIRERSESPMK